MGAPRTHPGRQGLIQEIPGNSWFFILSQEILYFLNRIIFELQKTQGGGTPLSFLEIRAQKPLAGGFSLERAGQNAVSQCLKTLIKQAADRPGALWGRLGAHVAGAGVLKPL